MCDISDDYLLHLAKAADLDLAHEYAEAFNKIVHERRLWRVALREIADGATGYLDRDSELAEIARKALGE